MLKSRKFVFTLVLTLLYTMLLLAGKIDMGTYAALMGTLVPLYFAANVGQKVFTPKETP